MAYAIKLKNKILKALYNSPLEKNINLILRYAPIVKALKEIQRKNKNLKVLEVGSGTIGITRFYNGEVIGVDIEAEAYGNPRLKFIKGSAVSLPFKDNSFDVVLSVDTLEHLTRKEQIKMILEAYRVAKKYIMITYPVGFTKYHEKMVKLWKQSHLVESLKEHLHGGTPKGDEIEKALNGKKYRLVVEYGTGPRLAYYLNYLEQNILTKVLSRTLLKLFLPLFKLSKGDTRRHYFVAKLDEK